MGRWPPPASGLTYPLRRVALMPVTVVPAATVMIAAVLAELARRHHCAA